jgi:hypothetical protein
MAEISGKPNNNEHTYSLCVVFVWNAFASDA